MRRLFFAAACLAALSVAACSKPQEAAPPESHWADWTAVKKCANGLEIDQTPNGLAFWDKDAGKWVKIAETSTIEDMCGTSTSTILPPQVVQ
jgi:hypothetical protein